MIRFALVLLFGIFTTAAFANSWPNRPIRMVVPWPPGGVTDIQARAIAEEMAPLLGQPIIIENRPGAGGKIGSDAVAKSAPDGYTLLLINANHPVLAVVDPKLPFDAVKDFTPIARMSNTCLVLMASTRMPVTNTAEFIAYARRQGGKLNYASIGPGSAHQLLMELFKLRTGLAIEHIPYRGEAPAAQALLAGEVDVMFMAGAKPYLGSGKAVGLGVTSAKPWFTFPELRPIGETLPGFELNGWNGLAGPAGLPPEIVARLAASANQALASEKVRRILLESGYEPTPGTPAEFGRLIQQDIARWRTVVTDAKLTFEQ